MSAASLDANLNNDFVFHVENRCRLPRIDTIERLALSLGISPAWLTYGEGHEGMQQERPMAPHISERLRDTRCKLGLSRAALGRAAQTTGQTIANIETGGMLPKVDTVELLAKALGVSPSWLAFGLSSHSTATVRNENVPSH